MGPLQKYMIWYAQPNGGGIPPKLCLEAATEFRQGLNETQEKVLLGHIGQLVNRGAPPTPAIVKNIAEEIHGGQLGKHCVTRFIQRHSLHLNMQNIENLRKKAEYSPVFQLFYNLVLAITLLKIVCTDIIIVNRCNGKISDYGREYV